MKQIEVAYERPKLFPKQRQFIDDPARFTYIEAGTKSGKTMGMIIWLHEQVIASQGTRRNFWWVAPYYRTTKMAYDRWWQFLPVEVRKLFKKKETDLTIEYPITGHRVSFLSAEKPDTLYGEDVYDAVLDEASRMREESWNAIRTTLTATNGRAKIIGNMKGRKNWFFRNARKAKENGDAYYLLTSYDNPHIDPKELEKAKKTLPEYVFNELYMSIPTDDGANPFGIDHIRRNVQKALSTKEPKAYGIDLAKHVNYTVIVGLDEDGQVCRFKRFQKDWKQTKEIILDEIGDVKTAIDCTGVGDPIVEDLQRERGNIEGVKFTPHSKQQMMEGLASSIQNGNTGILEGVMQVEMESFEFEYTKYGVKYSSPAGQDDDCVDGLALANRKLNLGAGYGEYAIL